MWKKQLCLGLNADFGVSYEEQLSLLKAAGFDGFFVVWNDRLDWQGLVRRAEESGLLFQSIHAPWGKAADMWHDDNVKGAAAVAELKQCVDTCVMCGVSLLVAHAFVGFEEHNPTAIGLARFGEVVDYAQKRGVNIAFENTEGEEYLAALMSRFADADNVGFCWDSGHEMCYNHSKDMLALYGDRLLCTHLNDNLGISDYGGKTIWTDDLHLLPFDGVADWQDIVVRLDRCGFDNVLTFELNKTSKPNRHDNDVYERMDITEYIAEAYKRACRVSVMLLRLRSEQSNTNDVKSNNVR